MAGLPSTLAIETACLSAWPAIGVVHDGAWLWRYAQGFTKRSNCFQSLDPNDEVDAEQRIARLCALSLKNGIDPVFRVTPLAGSQVVAALDRAGWESFDESRVLAMEIEAVRMRKSVDLRLFPPNDPRWIRAQLLLNRYSAPTGETLKILTGLIVSEAKGIIVCGPEGAAAAATLAVVAGEIGVFLNVVTDRTRRREGYGEAVMRGALNWTREHGARYAAIQVMSDNEPAICLYEKLGFVEQYRYHYRRPQ